MKRMYVNVCGLPNRNHVTTIAVVVESTLDDGFMRAFIQFGLILSNFVISNTRKNLHW